MLSILGHEVNTNKTALKFYLTLVKTAIINNKNKKKPARMWRKRNTSTLLVRM
jgi:hypothetical protein